MPNEYRFLTADVFTEKIFGGNQLAVFPQATGLESETMQKIAREMNLSESVFVFPPETTTGTRRLRIFTPGAELPFAGHPTIGAAFVLATIGEIPLVGRETRIVFEEGVGPIDVLIQSECGQPTFAQLSVAKLPEEGPPAPSIAQLADVLSLPPNQILDGTARPRAFSCGLPFLFIEVRDLSALGAIRIRVDQWEQHLAPYWATEIFVLTREHPCAVVRARMFAPGLEIVEDPATGSAAAALAGFLAGDAARDGILRWTVHQGVEMGRPSEIEVEADVESGRIKAVRVGGASVLVSEGVLKLPRP